MKHSFLENNNHSRHNKGNQTEELADEINFGKTSRIKATKHQKKIERRHSEEKMDRNERRYK